MEKRGQSGEERRKQPRAEEERRGIRCKSEEEETTKVFIFLTLVHEIPDVGELMLASFPSTPDFHVSVSPKTWYVHLKKQKQDLRE